VDLSTLSVSLSPAVVFADNTDIGMYTSISAVSPLQYLLLFYNGYDTTPETTYVAAGPLNVVVANIPPSASSAAPDAIPVPILSDPQEFEDVLVNVYMAATALNNDTVVLAYCDASNSNGVSFRALKVSGNTSVGEFSCSQASAFCFPHHLALFSIPLICLYIPLC
jgi:hypothetical protein